MQVLQSLQNVHRLSEVSGVDRMKQRLFEIVDHINIAGPIGRIHGEIGVGVSRVERSRLPQSGHCRSGTDHGDIYSNRPPVKRDI